jgi:hypothetical protein
MKTEAEIRTEIKNLDRDLELAMQKLPYGHTAIKFSKEMEMIVKMCTLAWVLEEKPITKRNYNEGVAE